MQLVRAIKNEVRVTVENNVSHGPKASQMPMIDDVLVHLCNMRDGFPVLHLIPRVTPIKKYPRASLCHLDTWNELTRLHTIHLFFNPCKKHPGDLTVQLRLCMACVDLGLLWYEIQVCVVLVLRVLHFFFFYTELCDICVMQSWKILTINDTCFHGQSGLSVERAADFSGWVLSTALTPCLPPLWPSYSLVSEDCSRTFKTFYSWREKVGACFWGLCLQGLVG